MRLRWPFLRSLEIEPSATNGRTVLALWIVLILAVISLGFFPSKVSASCEDADEIVTLGQLAEWSRLFKYSPETHATAYQLGIVNFSRYDERLAELVGLLRRFVKEDGTVPKNIEGLKQVLNGWARNYGLPISFAAYTDFGQHDTMEWGYIVDTVYAATVVAGKHPLADSHDLFSHVAAYLLEGYQSSFQERAKLVLRTAELGKIEKFYVFEAESFFRTSSQNVPESQIQKAAVGIYHWLKTVLRVNTWENFYFFRDNADATSFVYLGNAVYRAILDYEKEDFKKLAFTMLPPSPFTFRVDRLPGFSRFAANRRDLVDAWQAKAKIFGIDRPISGRIMQWRLRSALRAAQKRMTPEDLAKPLQERFMTFTSRLHEVIKDDPELFGLFDAKDRLEAMRLSVSLLSEYLQWAEANLKG